jgi:hypothetical protein
MNQKGNTTFCGGIIFYELKTVTRHFVEEQSFMNQKFNMTFCGGINRNGAKNVLKN